VTYRTSETQSTVAQEHREVQIDMKVLRRESKPRNHLERIYLTYSREPIKQHLLSYSALCLPYEMMATLDPHFMEIVSQQTTIIVQRLDEIFGIFKFKEEIFDEDFDETNLFIRETYNLFNSAIA
jgi:hypothetical protein